MKVKKYYKEYDGWKTELQWAKLGKIAQEGAHKEQLWHNQFCGGYAFYVSPNEVREMTPEEVEDFKASERAKKREQRKEAKRRKEIEDQKTRYWHIMREEWHTEWQWYDLGRKVKIGTEFTRGQALNGSDGAVFGSSYWYCHLDDTVEFESEEDREATYKSLYRGTYGKDPE